MAVNASVRTGGNSEGFLIHIISAMNYIERSKIFKKWVSAKTKVDNQLLEIQDVQNHLDDLNAKLKNAQERADESTTASTVRATKKGMIDTPAIPVELSEKIQKLTDDIDEFKETYKDHIEVLKAAQEVRGEAGNAIFALYKNLLDEMSFSDGIKLSKT